MYKADPEKFLSPGWKKTSQGVFPTFTTSRPRQSPGYKPAGIKQCTEEDIRRWTNDEFRFPPYQYQFQHCLHNKAGEVRVPNAQEREVLMGFPKDYTMNCLPKGQQGSQKHVDARLTLVGNSWNVMVVSWLLSKLGHILGLNEALSVMEIVQRTSPGTSTDFQSFLQRPAMASFRGKVTGPLEKQLVQKFLSQVSIKGEDILLQSKSEDLTRYHRLRASIPARLWRWRTAASWRWQSQNERINVLELRAVLTSLRWRLERR